MNIQDALTPTGKAVDEHTQSHYVAEDDNGVLHWYLKASDKRCHTVILESILMYGWLPYPEEKEIRPEKAGELWQSQDGSLGITHNNSINNSLETSQEAVYITFTNGSKQKLNQYAMIHNKNGWTRLYPEVKDGKEPTN